MVIADQHDYLHTNGDKLIQTNSPTERQEETNKWTDYTDDLNSTILFHPASKLHKSKILKKKISAYLIDKMTNIKLDNCLLTIIKPDDCLLAIIKLIISLLVCL